MFVFYAMGTNITIAVFFIFTLAHRGCLSVETFQDGMDFYFPDKGKAARFISFLENAVPTKVSSENVNDTNIDWF